MTESETRTQAENSRLLYASLAKAREIALVGLSKAEEAEDAEAFRFVVESILDGVSAETHTLEEVDAFIVGALWCRSANIDHADLRKLAYDIEGLLSDADEHLCSLNDESPK